MCKGVGAKSSAFIDGRQVVSPGNVRFTSAVAQAQTIYFYLIEGVTGMRNTSSMGEAKKSLAETHPALARQADGWDPSTVLSGSNKKLRWRCPAGHVWDAVVGSRANGSGCPICSNLKVLAGFNDLASKFPEIANEADGWDPTTVIAGSHKKMGWKCKEGHQWQATPGNRTGLKQGCGVCSGRQVLSGFNDLNTSHPEIAAEAFEWDPRTVSAGSERNENWKCPAGHIWKSRIYSRTGSNKTKCPICQGRKVLAGFNDLATTHPELAKEASGWDPTTISFGSGKVVKWKCELGHVWKTDPNSRSSQGSGCPVCSTGGGTKKIEVGFNDLATTHPELAKQAVGWDPTTVFSGSGERLLWGCALGHEWLATPGNRSSKNATGCPYCANKKVLAGFNDLASTHPDIAKQAVGWDPTKVTAGSGKKGLWECEIGHQWTSVISSRTLLGAGCAVCTGKQILVGFNDLASTFPLIASQANGWDPRTVFAGSQKTLSWKCSEGHIWKANPGNRTGSETGCPSCSVGGFDPNKPGWLYLLKHEKWELLQIGISNVIEDRLQTHKYSGWEVLDVRGPIPGDVTYGWEQSILQCLHREGAQFATPDTAGKFSGYTEAWRTATFPANSLRELMDRVLADEDNPNQQLMD